MQFGVRAVAFHGFDDCLDGISRYPISAGFFRNADGPGLNGRGQNHRHHHDYAQRPHNLTLLQQENPQYLFPQTPVSHASMQRAEYLLSMAGFETVQPILRGSH